jgi:hypothetical protein
MALLSLHKRWFFFQRKKGTVIDMEATKEETVSSQIH